MKKIRLTLGMSTMVDNDDFEKLNKYKWYANLWNKKAGTKYYAERNTWINKKAGHAIMHRIIMNAPKGMVVDHINGNTLDNRKSNLRVVTRFINQQNRQGAMKNNKSGVLGVYYYPKHKKYQVHICRNSKKKYLGLYKTIREAKKAYANATLSDF